MYSKFQSTSVLLNPGNHASKYQKLLEYISKEFESQ